MTIYNGTSGDDTFTGTGDGDFFYGLDGSDTIAAGAGMGHDDGPHGAQQGIKQIDNGGDDGKGPKRRLRFKGQYPIE